MMKEILQSTISYAKAGFTVFKVRGKIAAKKKWQVSEYLEPEHIEEHFEDWNDNFGVLIGENDLVIDIDPRNFVCTKCYKIEKMCECDEFTRDKTHLRLFADIGTDLKDHAHIVKTGGGGLHMYLKIPEGVSIGENDKKYKGIEFKTKGRYVVGAFSVHPESGRRYVVSEKGRGINDIQPSPQLLLKIIKKSEKKTELKENIKGNRDGSVATVERYTNFLEGSDPAVSGAGGDELTLRAAYKGRDLGLSAGKTFELMSRVFNPKCMPPWSLEDLAVKVKNAYTYAKGSAGQDHPESDFKKVKVSKHHPLWRGWDFQMGTNNKLKTKNNVVNYFLLENSPLYESLVYNEFTGTIRTVKHLPWWPENTVIPKDGIQWSDGDNEDFRLWLGRKHFFDVSEELIQKSVGSVARMKRVHPVKDYLTGLKWDGVSRLDSWLIACAKAKDNIYVRAISKMVLMQAVERIYRPGCKADYVMILEGEQGVGKSSLVEILGGDFYGDIHIDPRNKDTIDGMRSKWILEMSEMAVLKKSDVESLKSFVTRKVDTVRLAYARNSVDLPRQCIFIGTVNRDAIGQYLNDTTGNRRWMPVEIGKVKFKLLEEIRDQLFAEAVDKFFSGEESYIKDPAVLSYAESEQRKRQAADPWEHSIHDYIMNSHPAFITTKEVWLFALKGNDSALNTGHARRIATCLKEMGYEAKVRRTDHGVKRGFINKKFERMEKSRELDLGDLLE